MALPIHIRTTIKEGHLDLRLPPDVDGEVEVIIRLLPALESQLSLEEARARLLAGGSLQTHFGTGEPVEEIPDDELEILGQLAEGAPSIEEILNEVRGEY